MTDRYLISYNNVDKSIKAKKMRAKKKNFYIKTTHLQVKKNYFLLEISHCNIIVTYFLLEIIYCNMEVTHCNMEKNYFLLEMNHCNMEIVCFLSLFKFFYLLFSHYFILNIFFNKQRAFVGCTCKKKDLISFVFSC